MKSIVLEGTEFVKASEAAKEHGYTSDYIGQLCRSNKVIAQLVGRTWYVSLESLLKHRKSRYRSSQKKTKEEVKKTLAEVSVENKEHSPRFYNRLVSETSIHYISEDQEDLIPEVKKIAVDSEEETNIKTVEEPRVVEVTEPDDVVSEYSLNTVIAEKPKSGVLRIVEDETEVPVNFKEAAEIITKPKAVSANNKLQRSAEEKPHLRHIHTKVAVSPRLKPNNERPRATKPTVVKSEEQPLFRAVAPLSISLLVGLVIAMLMVSVSWQFQTENGDYTEKYRVNMSSAIQK